MQTTSNRIEQIFSILPTIPTQHIANSPTYQLLQDLAYTNIKSLFSNDKSIEQNFAPFGSLVFPYHKMGAKDSLDLFGLDELILFSFYYVHRKHYKKVLDIGANLGLHTILLSKLGYHVEAFEPDAMHFSILQKNIELNGLNSAILHNVAVSNHSGKAEFVRVLGNTTSSHLAGSKNPYGELEKYEVDVLAIQNILEGVDLIKMDVEGHEVELLTSLSPQDFQKIDLLVEVGTQHNAEKIFSHIKKSNASMFAQKIGWNKVQSVTDMPCSYKEGTLFISSKSSMSWQDDGC